MNKKIYETVTMHNGLKMLAALPINNTGIAEAYYTIRDNPMGNSTGDCAPFSCNIYKKLGVIEGIEDFKLCCDALGITPDEVASSRLIYATNDVKEYTKADMESYDVLNEPSQPHCDGIVTNEKGITLFSYAADCILINFVDIRKKIIGSCHCSWGTTIKGIVENEVNAFTEKYSSDTTDIIAFIWPGISQERFEVGSECSDKFIDAGFGQFVDTTSYDKPHIDLQGVNKQILLNCGLTDENIYVLDDLCTMRDEKLLHSYRRGPVNPETKAHLNGMNGCFIRLI